MAMRMGNRQDRRASGLALATAGTAALLAARIWPAPAMADPTGAALPDGLHLSVPWLHILAAPLFTLWDGTTMLSLSRLEGLVVGLAVLYVLWGTIRVIRHKHIVRELGLAAATVVGFAAFVVVGALWHRPMIALTGAPEHTIVDFHSHTNASHDVNGLRGGFDIEASRRWHQQAGFDAFFVTDHNTTEALAAEMPPGRPYVCPGVEISAWRAHILLLGAGPADAIDRRPYTDSLAGVLALLRDASQRFGALSIASIPEYERYHWDNLDTLLAAGLHGFEIVNASPQANELSRARRDIVIDLARRANRLVLGVSDSHGWGATSMVWNLVPGPPADAPCAAILDHMAAAGFAAVQVVERHRLRADAAWPWVLTPIGLVWETWRGMGWILTLGWLGWLWGGVLLGHGLRQRRELAKRPHPGQT